MTTYDDEEKFRIMYQMIRDIDGLLLQLYELYTALPEGSLKHEKTWISMKIAKTHLKCAEDKFDELTKRMFDCPAHRLRRTFWEDIVPDYTPRKWGNSCGVRNSANTCCPLDHQDHVFQSSDAFTRFYVGLHSV